MEEQEIAALSKGTFGFEMLGGEDFIEDKADHNFLHILQVDLPLLEGAALIEDVIMVSISQP